MGNHTAPVMGLRVNEASLSAVVSDEVLFHVVVSVVLEVLPAMITRFVYVSLVGGVIGAYGINQILLIPIP